MIAFSNFVRTTLRSPVTPSDTTLLLEAGSGALFAIPSGDYCYLTVNDGVTVEIMKYTSIGPVFNDTIPVARAQDGTTAKAFPAGACVQVAWNKAQLSDFVVQLYNEMFNAALLNSDTVQVSSTPVAAPPGGVYYAVNPATHQFWYWNVNGPGWVEIGNIANGIVVVTSAPVTAPPPNVRFAVNTTDSSLWYWNNTGWIQLSGGGSSGAGGAEVWARRSTNTVNLAPGESLDGTYFSWTDNVHWQANPASSILTFNASQQFAVAQTAVVQFMCGIRGTTTAGLKAAGTLVLASDDASLVSPEWGNAFSFAAGQTQPAVVLSCVTPEFRILGGSVVAMNFIYDGSSASNILVEQAYFSARVTAVL